MRKLLHAKGLSVVEMLIGFAIIAVLAAFIFTVLSNIRDQKELDHAVDITIALFRKARSRTLASEEGFAFGVHWDAGRIIEFRGPVFVEGAQTNDVRELSARVETADSAIAGNTVVFERLTGRAVPSGAFHVRLKRKPELFRTIIIEQSGLVYVQ